MIDEHLEGSFVGETLVRTYRGWRLLGGVKKKGGNLEGPGPEAEGGGRIIWDENDAGSGAAKLSELLD